MSPGSSSYWVEGKPRKKPQSDEERKRDLLRRSRLNKCWKGSAIQRIPNLTGPVDNNDVMLQRNMNKTAGRIDGCHGDCNLSDSLMAADGDCHHLCKLMAPVRHRWSINDVIGGIRNTVMPSDCSPVAVKIGPHVAMVVGKCSILLEVPFFIPKHLLDAWRIPLAS
ncbi:hypothetical protein ANN_22454 [Periplaneta americana]|uniref:Uncharacterized protein n=1 Tax=Periplaneta americana TaxID=6978 RepID=A0ABQ8S870_PERAM|nr:hypothetical protein ANN_22454 [Periplaneta americana]